MALQKSGVKLVAENESGFLGAMGKAQKAVQGFEGSAGRAASGGLSALNIGTAAVAGVIGGVLFSAVSRAISGFFDLGKAAFGVVASYERLSMSLSALTAKELLNAGATDNMADALEMAAPAARELLNWVEELAIKSPFDQEGVANALRTAVAYGFVTTAASTVEEAQAKGIVTAQRLTQALIDWSSGAGLTSFAMERVALALGQMQAKGKVSGQELRQLTEAGFGANAILEKMGVTLNDVEEGTVDATEFIKVFAESIESDFGGAAVRASGTLSGLANSLSDLGKRYLREFFGPIDQSTGKLGGILGAVQPLLQKFVDTLMDERVLQAVQKLGLLIGEGLTGGLQGLANILTTVVRTIQKPFNQAATNAFSWGQNIIVSLAQGIINAAGSILINAINFVGQILANWFAPGSPPAVAPELIEWGQAAMGEWLHGFTSADFDVLKSIQQPLQTALQTMVQAGLIDQEDFAQTYADLTAGLAEALATGGDPTAILNQIANEAGSLGPEIAELARLQFELAGGVEAVEQAEQDLANARKAEENAGKAVMQLTQEYNDLLRSGADDATLQAKLEEINAAEEAKVLAGEQADAAETQLDAAQANLAVMEEQVKLQKELLDTLLELARLSIIPGEGEVDPATGEGGAGGGGGVPELPGLDLPDPGEAVASFLDAIISEIQNAAAAMFAPITEAWNTMIGQILTAWNNFIALLNASGLLAQMQSIWDSLVALTQIAFSILGEFIMTGLQTLFNLWLTHRDAVLGIWSTFWNLVASIAGGIMGLIVSNISQRLEELRTFFENNRQQISSIIQLFWENFQLIVNTFMGSILSYIQTQLEFLQGLWDTHGQQALRIVDEMWDEISKTTFGVLDVVVDFIEGALESVRGFWQAHGEAVTTIVNWFLGIVGGVFQTVMTALSFVVLGILSAMNGFWQAHGETIVGLVETALGFILGVFNLALGALGLALEAFAALITGDWSTFLEAIQTAWDTSWNTISTILTTIAGNIMTTISGLLDDVSGKIGEFVTIGENMMQGLIDGALSKADAIVTAIKTMVANAIAAALDALRSDSPSKVFANIGTSIPMGLAVGIEAEKQAPLSALSDTISALLSPAMVAAPAGASYQNTMNLTMNNNVSGGMDVAALDAHIVQVVKRQFGGRS